MATKKRIYMLEDASETVGIYVRKLPANSWQSVDESQANAMIEAGVARDSEDVREVGHGKTRRKSTAVPSPAKLRESTLDTEAEDDAEVPSQE